MITPFLASSLLLLLLHHATSHLVSGPHIADVNILLPPKMTHPVEYRLQGSDGCFKWSWDHHDILSVLPEYNSSSHCSTSARLRSIAPYGGRKETAVYATDLSTGMMIRCKVYIDMISRIQIFHNSIKLDLDGLATLRVRAFDSEENVFSSLVGLQFMWQMMPETHGLPHSLDHVPLKDSPLSDCGGLCGDLDIQVKLEESGVFSDFYMVKGTEIGQEIVSVNLLEPSVEHLADKIVLTVAEAMSLDPPSPVNVLIGAVVHYTLKVIRSNSPHIVSLPSPFHQWSALNSSIAHVDRAMGIIHALNLGITTIVVEDTRVVGHMQISSFHVVLPDNLLLFMSPLSPSGDHIDGVKPIPSVSRWYVVAGRSYLIHIKVFSPRPGVQEIFITESDEIELHDNQEDFWNILPFSESTTTKRNNRILEASSYGLGKLTATLAYSTGHDKRKEVLKVVQEVMVCDQVNFITTGESNVSFRILLPWVPGVYQEMELKASGGCAMSPSDYKWFSSDMDVVSVSVSGIVQAKMPGKSTIRAVSIFDPLNYDEIVIEVSIPHSLVLLPNFPVETPVGSHLQASVTLKASNGAYFYACDAFRPAIRWTTESNSFIIVNSTAVVSDKQEAVVSHSTFYGPPCAWTNIYASNSGRTILHATLTRENQFSDHTGRESIVSKVSSSIAAFLPLVVHQASDGNQFGGYWFDMAHSESQNQLSNLDYLYLAPGAHLDVMLRGGPERWGKDVEFIENVEVLAEQSAYVKDRVVAHHMSISNGNFYRVGCESLGTFKVVFRRGNLMGEDHNLPVVSEVQLFLICSFPSSIVIVADEALNTPPIIQSAAKAERMPGRIRASPVTVANGRRIRISAVGLSDSGKAFANSSSLSLNWELTECEGLAVFDEAHSSTVYSSWEKFLILQNSSGLCSVRSTVVSFINSLSHFDFTTMFGTSKNTLTDAIQLQLVSSLRLNPEFDDDIYIDGAKIITKESGNIACIQAKDRSTGRTEVASCVRVAEVAQIRITTDEFPIHMLALGAEFDLQIKYHDTLGNPFHEAHNVKLFEVDTNYPDVVSIDKYDGHGNIHLRAKSQGLALVQVSFVSNPRKSVYAVISVGPQLYPQNPVVHQGTSLTFDVKGFSNSASGQWFSANESILFVEKLSGKAEAIGEGTTHLHFESSSLKLYTLVTVLKGNIVSVNAPNEVLTNVPFPAKGYAFSVHFSDDSGKSILFLFDCSVNPPNVGFAKPWKDPHTGKSYCLFFPYSPENIARSSPKSGDTPKQVLVSVTASLSGDQHISGSASALFIGGFSIVELDKNSQHLNLSRGPNEQVITIVGNTDVELHWNNKNRLSVRPIQSEDHAAGKYAVSVHGDERFQDKLVFSLPATGQKVEISVSYDPEAPIEPELPLWVPVLGLLFVLILTAIFFICYLDQPVRPHPVQSTLVRSSPVVSSSPNVAAPLTPDRSSPAVVNDQSPRTPQPFMDYVRRTIDETPYYRQDFRRRASPQNTF
ncbi:hypothetical protein ACS0TY_028160 [Phlomoides rotata]